jgi:hypothetical protein
LVAILDSAVGPYAVAGVELVNQSKLFPVIATVRVQAASKRSADAQFVVRPTVFPETLKLVSIVLYMRISRHGILTAKQNSTEG